MARTPSPPNRPEAAVELVEFLQTQILTGVYPPGSRLPSIRALMHKFHLCFGTALNGIDYLCHCGLLEKRPSRGVFVRRAGTDNSGDHRRGVIGLISQYPDFNEFDQGFVYTAIGAIRKMADELGYTLRSIPVMTASTPIPAGPDVGCDAMILLREFDSFPNPFHAEVPTAAIMQFGDFDGRISVVEIDPVNTASQAVAYFKKHGVSEVRIFTDYRAVYWHRAKVFEDLWRRAGGSIAATVETYSSIPDLSRCRYSPACGHFFTSDHLYEILNRHYRAANPGADLADRFCVLSVDGKSLLMPDFASVPTIAADWKWIGRTVFEEVIARLENPLRPPRRIYLAGQLTCKKQL